MKKITEKQIEYIIIATLVILLANVIYYVGGLKEIIEIITK